MNSQVSKPLPPAVTLAFDCLARIRKDEPKIAGGYLFPRSEYSEQVERKAEDKVVYHTPEGVRCTQSACAAIMGLSESGAYYLFNRYKSDYKYIYENHGATADFTKYKNDNGEIVSHMALAIYFQTTQQAIRHYYRKAGGDYKIANAALKNRFGDRIGKKS